MARQLDQYMVFYTVRRLENGTYERSDLQLEAAWSDPAAVKPGDKGQRNFRGSSNFPGGQTYNAIDAIVRTRLEGEI